MTEAATPVRVACPRCGRRTRLTAPELAARRGFCATCGARFELDEPTVAGDGPTRALVQVVARPPAVQSRRGNLVVRSPDPLELELRSGRSRVVPAVAFSAAAATVALAAAGLTAWDPMWILILVVQGFLWRRPAQRLRIEPGRLTIFGPRGAAIAVPLDASLTAVPSPRGTLSLRCGPHHHVLGLGLGLSLDDAVYLRDVIVDAAGDPVR